MPPERPSSDVAEAALARVVGGAEHERAEDLLFAVDCPASARRRPARRDRRPRPLRRTPRLGRRTRPSGAEDDAAAVEDQVVVAADLVDVDDVDAVAAGEHAEHLLAHRLLAGRERRGRQVEEDGGAQALDRVDRIGEVARPLPEVAVVPDVLADADGGAPAGDVERLETGARLEVAVLVEDVVGRQQALDEQSLDRRRRAAAPRRSTAAGRRATDSRSAGRPGPGRSPRDRAPAAPRRRGCGR